MRRIIVICDDDDETTFRQALAAFVAFVGLLLATVAAIGWLI